MSTITVRSIVAQVAERYDVSATDLMSDRNTRSLLEPRMVVIGLAARLTLCSGSQIARQFNRSHSAIWHARHRFEERLVQDAAFAHAVATLVEALGPPADRLAATEVAIAAEIEARMAREIEQRAALARRRLATVPNGFAIVEAARALARAEKAFRVSGRTSGGREAARQERDARMAQLIRLTSRDAHV